MNIPKVKFILLISLLLNIGNQAKGDDSILKVEPSKNAVAKIINKKDLSDQIELGVPEQIPVSWGNVPLSTREANIDTAKIFSMIKKIKTTEDVFICEHEIPKDDVWSHQTWTYYMTPVQDGVEIALLVETHREGLPQFFGVRQNVCLSGRIKSAIGRRDGKWGELAGKEHPVAAPTPIGIAIDKLVSKRPEFEISLNPVDDGLITVADPQGGWICGMYWEGTSHLLNSSGENCLQSIVNIGNIPPFAKRMLRGKLYWFKGDKDDLAAHFERDFRGEHIANKLRVATCQFPLCSDLEENSRWIQKQMCVAKINRCDIVHFPEGALSGYANADFSGFENYNWELLWQETDSIMAFARDLKLWVVLGSAHKLSGNNKPHNSLYVINPDGTIIDRYDKRFCTSGDLKYYSPGDHFTIFEINNVRCGLLICYDLRFPELFREYRKLNADIIFHSFNNSRHGIDCIHPKIMPITAQARAGTNAFYISINNSSAPYGWASEFITPDGLVNGKLAANKPGVLISDVDTTIDFYDASRPYRMDAINGKLNSGETVDDPRSRTREGYK